MSEDGTKDNPWKEPRPPGTYRWYEPAQSNGTFPQQEFAARFLGSYRGIPGGVFDLSSSDSDLLDRNLFMFPNLFGGYRFAAQPAEIRVPVAAMATRAASPLLVAPTPPAFASAAVAPAAMPSTTGGRNRHRETHQILVWITEADIALIRHNYSRRKLKTFQNTAEPKSNKARRNRGERYVRLFLHEWEALNVLRRQRNQAEEVAKHYHKSLPWKVEARQVSDAKRAEEVSEKEEYEEEVDGDEIEEDEDYVVEE